MTPKTILWQSDQEPCGAARDAIATAGFNLIVVDRSEDVTQPDEIVGIIADHRERWDRRRLAQFPRAEAIVRLGVGVDNVDVNAAKAAGFHFDSVPAYGTTDVADHTLAMVLDLSRNLTARSENLRMGGARAWQADLQNGFRLRDRELAVVGLGRIGTSVALRAQAFGMRIVFYDPHRDEGVELAHGWRRAHSLREVAAADVVTLHCPATEETRRLIDDGYWRDVAEIGPPNGQVLVNTARGSIVDWAAFTRAFDTGLVRGAAFDVLEQEPFIDDDPMVRRWRAADPAVHGRLLLTPHVAFASPEAVLDLHHGAATRLVRSLKAVPRPTSSARQSEGSPAPALLERH
ncbi:hypothetical protein OG607_41225 [Streptomyces sp. NBC_01537]|uniref:NAD(P)-dependent oxidoreductase n=1 Tax=Streptomyces sp. NBC_01537 TaxID=2903896 RepID=UPI0038635C6D